MNNMQKYNHSKIEKKWQDFWENKKVFQAKDFAKRPKKYVLAEFPYPSGEGLHMGHLRPYVAGDVYSRFKRMQGNEVVYPMGWDAFGLPAENYAIKKGIHPSITTKKNISNAKKQMQSWGLSFDWSREINTTDPDYYKWTQWLFLQFYKAGLAYEATGLINWCPKDKTGLANEEVIDGKCERCGTVVEKKELRQWYLKITAYAEKLLEGLKHLPAWPSAVKLQQENWIGKKMGINISYDIYNNYNFILLHGKHGGPVEKFFPWLKKQLEDKGCKVQVPQMPNTEEPNDDEQTEYVINNCKFDEKTVIVGHSFGGVVALRLLEKGIRVNKIILAATPFTSKFLDGKTRNSVAKALAKGFDFSLIKKNAKSFVGLYDENDDIVSPEEGKQYAKLLGGAYLKVKANSPHFGSELEPTIKNTILPNIEVFTTRPDTNFGATFVVLGPEHQLLRDKNILNIDEQIWQKIKAYQDLTSKEADNERTDENRKKTGVFTGLYCTNTLNNYRMPLYVADYVLGNVGTGAVVGVPGHDKRDFEFARVFNIPAVRVVQKDADDILPITSIDQVQEDEGVMVNSGFLNGLNIHDATDKIMDYMEQKGYGKRVVNYKLRDWVFSRQRYWGEPIPIIHCPKCGIVPVPEKDLPVKLPSVKNYQPTGTGESPLAAVEKWLNVKCPVCKSPAKREANTMPNWAGSSWYWLRYTDPKNKKSFADLNKQKYWTPVDVYFGGMEHTTLHLLYSRFWNLFLYDQGLVTSREPYLLRKPHGIILGPDGEKMSKSRGNVVNPQDIVASHGADTLRMFELFLGPHEDTIAWNSNSVVGVKRFLDRVWAWVNQVASYESRVASDSEKVARELNKLIKKVTEDIENFHFNTCVSAFMGFLNEIKDEDVSAESVKAFLKLLYPFAPHISEELNQLVDKWRGRANRQQSLQLESWPEFDPAMIVDQTVEIVVQVNGKVKGKVTAPSGSDEVKVKELGMNLPAVKILLNDQQIKRVVFVRDRLINFVI
jgi:leucyl-tRNA synthetase